MGENTRCFKRKKGFVYGQRATHTISVISVGDTVSQRSRRAAEAQRRGGGGVTAVPVIYSQIPTKHISTI